MDPTSILKTSITKLRQRESSYYDIIHTPTTQTPLDARSPWRRRRILIKLYATVQRNPRDHTDYDCLDGRRLKSRRRIRTKRLDSDKNSFTDHTRHDGFHDIQAYFARLLGDQAVKKTSVRNWYDSILEHQKQASKLKRYLVDSNVQEIRQFDDKSLRRSFIRPIRKFSLFEYIRNCRHKKLPKSSDSSVPLLLESLLQCFLALNDEEYKRNRMERTTCQMDLCVFSSVKQQDPRRCIPAGERRSCRGQWLLC